MRRIYFSSLFYKYCAYSHVLLYLFIRRLHLKFDVDLELLESLEIANVATSTELTNPLRNAAEKTSVFLLTIMSLLFIVVKWTIVLFIVSIEATHQASANPSEPLVLPDLVRTIADFSPDRDLCTFSQLSKLHHESLWDNIQTRKEQKDARAEMVRLWDGIRGHPSWNWIFGGKLISNASSKAAIQHLLHQMDGRANVRCLEITGKRYAANLPHGTPSGRPLFQRIQQ